MKERLDMKTIIYLTTWCSSLLFFSNVEALGAPLTSSSSSVMHLRADPATPTYQKALEECLPTLDDFDKSKVLKATECFTSIDLALDEIVPISLRKEESFLQDIKDMAVTTSSMATRNDEIVVRLALVRGQKCPKWHEDWVRIRLLKAYYGAGTEYVQPNDNWVRLGNALKSAQGKDLAVEDPCKIEKCGVNDVLIIRGKKSKNEGFLPVLHRSPIAQDEKQRRLLLTITIP